MIHELPTVLLALAARGGAAVPWALLAVLDACRTGPALVPLQDGLVLAHAALGYVATVVLPPAPLHEEFACQLLQGHLAASCSAVLVEAGRWACLSTMQALDGQLWRLFWERMAVSVHTLMQLVYPPVADERWVLGAALLVRSALRTWGPPCALLELWRPAPLPLGRLPPASGDTAALSLVLLGLLVGRWACGQDTDERLHASLQTLDAVRTLDPLATAVQHLRSSQPLALDVSCTWAIDAVESVQHTLSASSNLGTSCLRTAWQIVPSAAGLESVEQFLFAWLCTLGSFWHACRTVLDGLRFMCALEAFWQASRFCWAGGTRVLGATGQACWASLALAGFAALRVAAVCVQVLAFARPQSTVCLRLGAWLLPASAPWWSAEPVLLAWMCGVLLSAVPWLLLWHTVRGPVSSCASTLGQMARVGQLLPFWAWEHGTFLFPQRVAFLF